MRKELAQERPLKHMVNLMNLFERTKIIEASSQLMEINLVQTVKEYLNSLPDLAVQTRWKILEPFWKSLVDV